MKTKEMHEGDICYLRAQYDSIVEMLHAAQVERDALRTALETYGRHRAGCRATDPMMAGREYLCACGLDDLVMRRACEEIITIDEDGHVNKPFMSERAVSDPVVTKFGRFRRCVRDDKPSWSFECPGCGQWGALDDDQFHGRVSVDHSGEGSCTYHETHDFFAALADVEKGQP